MTEPSNQNLHQRYLEIHPKIPTQHEPTPPLPPISQLIKEDKLKKIVGFVTANHMTSGVFSVHNGIQQ